MRPEWDLIEHIFDRGEYEPGGTVRSVTLGATPHWTAFLISALPGLNPRFARVDEGGVTFTVTNGTVRYAFRETNTDGQLVLAERVR